MMSSRDFSEMSLRFFYKIFLRSCGKLEFYIGFLLLLFFNLTHDVYSHKFFNHINLDFLEVSQTYVFPMTNKLQPDGC